LPKVPLDARHANLHLCCEPSANLRNVALLQIMQICIFKNQKMIEIDLASQSNSALLEASQHTNRRLT